MDPNREMGVGERMAQGMAGTASAMQKEMAAAGGERPTAGTVDQTTVDGILEGRGNIPRSVVRKVIERYGLPNEAVPSRMIWFESGPWKRSIVYRDEVPHNFPKPHTDVLEQFIDYRVPVDKFPDLAAYDGSVVPERTKGEISARCNMEEMNFLALNLAHDIVTGARSVEDARQHYAERAVAFMLGRPAPYTEGLRFVASRGDTADVDETKISQAMLDQMGEKMKDVVEGEPKR